jgi:hypothetical protein
MDYSILFLLELLALVSTIFCFLSFPTGLLFFLQIALFLLIAYL